MLCQHGLSARAYWITGSSEIDKSTIARLLAAEVADDRCIDEYVARELNVSRVTVVFDSLRLRGLGRRWGRARQRGNVVVCFTTTNDGEASLFGAHRLLTR